MSGIDEDERLGNVPDVIIKDRGIDIHHVDMEMIGSSRARRRRNRAPSHHDVIHFIAEAEREIYGEVVSDSVRDHVKDCLYDPRLIAYRYG